VRDWAGARCQCISVVSARHGQPLYLAAGHGLYAHLAARRQLRGALRGVLCVWQLAAGASAQRRYLQLLPARVRPRAGGVYRPGPDAALQARGGVPGAGGPRALHHGPGLQNQNRPVGHPAGGPAVCGGTRQRPGIAAALHALRGRPRQLHHHRAAHLSAARGRGRFGGDAARKRRHRQRQALPASAAALLRLAPRFAPIGRVRGHYH
nr:hypothetical protein [Tanacetum cinerariifolium]